MQQTIDLSILLPENANNTLLEQGIAQLQEYQAMRQLYNGAIREITTKLENLDDEFSTRYAHNPIHHMESRLKSLKSIVGKLQRKGLPLTLASAQKEGGEVAFIDVEHALEPAYARALGVDIDSLLISQPDTGEQALEITEQLVRSGALDVVVVDSVAALLPRSELEGEMGESSVGVIARLMSQALRKLAGTVSRTNCIVVFINQLREKIGVMYGNPETTPGGRALKYFSSVRIDVRRIETLKVGGEMIGNRTRAKIVKNKVAPPFKEAEFDIIYGEGISKIGEIVDLGVKLDLIDKAGAWYTYGDVRVQGRDSMKEFLREHPDVSDQIEAEIRANAHKLMSPQARKAAIASGRAVEVAADDFQG